MTLQEYADANEMRDAALAKHLGISRVYANMLRRRKKVPPPELALTIFERTGVRMGKLKDASERDIEGMRRIVGQPGAAA